MSETDRSTPKEYSKSEIEDKLKSTLQSPVTRRAFIAGSGAVVATGIAKSNSSRFNILRNIFRHPEPTQSTDVPASLPNEFTEASADYLTSDVQQPQYPENDPERLIEMNMTPPIHDYDLDRDEIIGEPDPEYDEFIRRMTLEPDIPPEQLPHRTVLGKLGYNVRGGEHADVILKDAKILRAKSIVLIGTNEELLQQVRHDTELLDSNGKRIPIISRFRAPKDSYDIEKFEPQFLHNLEVHKKYLAPDKTLEDLRKDPTLVIEILNEPNLYQATADIQDVVNGFMFGAKIARSHGFKVLIPPMAPHTPYDPEQFPNGDEMEYYDKFLKTLRSHEDFDSVKDAFELSVHAYVRHEYENPFPRIREIYEKVQYGLGLDLPIHITEFGISRDFLESHDDVAGAVEVARLINLPIPTDLSMIKTINFWTMQATSPKSEMSDNGEAQEDYSKQALRNSTDEVTIKYKALLHGFKTRLQDIHKIHNVAVNRSRTDY